MQKLAINIGDKIEMTHARSSVRGKLSENTYVSNLLDYDGWRTAKISAPIFEGKVIPVQVGDEYDLCFFSTSGLYQSRVKIQERYRDKKMFVLGVEMLTRPTKYQRRQFFRLDCVLKMRYRLVSQEEKTLRDFIAASNFDDPELLERYMKKLEEFLGDWEEATLTDISGGGVRFQCDDKMSPDQLVEISIPLAFEDETVSFHCLTKVVAVADIALKGSRQIELRCEFFEIDKEKQDTVVKYVFEEQRRRMRNKLGSQQGVDADD